MKNIKVISRGKINLGLRVLGTSEDGYHFVDMIMQSVELGDDILININKSNRISIRCNKPYVPTDERNIMYKAVKMYLDKYNIVAGVFINLYKRIPVSAGMAGGSGNGAAVLSGLNKFFKKASEEEILEMCRALGSDVSFCYINGTMRATHFGEELTALSPMPHCYILISKPNVFLSTKDIYQKIDNIEEREKGEFIENQIKALEKGDLKEICKNMKNDLYLAARYEVEEIDKLVSIMKKEGALGAMMSGSGPSVFGIFNDLETIKKCYKKLEELGLSKTLYITRPYNKGGKIC